MRFLVVLAFIFVFVGFSMADPQQDGVMWLQRVATESQTQRTPSGLVYRVIHEGTGANPAATSQVSVNYEGKLEDGTVFDSSYERGYPAQFGVSQVIPGWTEMLKLMKEGETVDVWIPSNLAYG